MNTFNYNDDDPTGQRETRLVGLLALLIGALLLFAGFCVGYIFF